jgi:hypothetical protein
MRVRKNVLQRLNNFGLHVDGQHSTLKTYHHVFFCGYKRAFISYEYERVNINFYAGHIFFSFGHCQCSFEFRL